MRPINPETKRLLYDVCVRLRWRPRVFRESLKEVLRDRAFEVRRPFVSEYIAFLAGISPYRLSRILGKDALPRLDDSDDAIAVVWAIGKLGIAMRSLERHGDLKSRRRLKALFGGNMALRNTFFERTKGFVSFVRSFEARIADAGARLDPAAKLEAEAIDRGVKRFLLGEGGFVALWPLPNGKAELGEAAHLDAFSLHVGLHMDANGLALPGPELDRIVADSLPARASFVVNAMLRNLGNVGSAQMKLLTYSGRPIDVVDFVLTPQGPQRMEWIYGAFENVVFPADVGRPKVELWLGNHLLGSRDFLVETR